MSGISDKFAFSVQTADDARRALHMDLGDLYGKLAFDSRRESKERPRTFDLDYLWHHGARPGFPIIGDLLWVISKVRSLIGTKENTPSEAELSEDGKLIFENLLPAIKKTLCEEWDACRKVDEYEDPAELVVVIADCFSAATFGVPGFTISLLVVKIGVKKLCGCAA
jgi:hypothetical protein